MIVLGDFVELGYSYTIQLVISFRWSTSTDEYVIQDDIGLFLWPKQGGLLLLIYWQIFEACFVQHGNNRVHFFVVELINWAQFIFRLRITFHTILLLYRLYMLQLLKCVVNSTNGMWTRWRFFGSSEFKLLGLFKMKANFHSSATDDIDNRNR